MLAFTHYSTDTRVRREAEVLTARGDEVDFICLKEDRTNQHTFNGVQLYPLSVRRYRGNSTLLYLTRYFSFFVRGFLLMTYLYYKNRYDIIQVHTMPDFMVFTALIPKICGAKVILDVHDLMPELFMSKFGVEKRHWLIKLVTWIELRSIAFAHNAIAVHMPHRDVLVSHGCPEEKFSILLNLPDSRIFGASCSAERIPDNKFRLIYHGTLARRHGLEIAIRAVGLAKKQIPNVELSIVGDGDNRENLIRIVDDQGLNNYVKFSDGKVALEELSSLIRQADIGVVPILKDVFTRYMLPVKLLEYVKVGIPVISSRTETIEFYFDETMIRFFEPGNHTELAEQIVDLYNDQQARRLLVSNARTFNREFAWEDHKTVYYDLIDSLL